MRLHVGLRNKVQSDENQLDISDPVDADVATDVEMADVAAADHGDDFYCAASDSWFPLNMNALSKESMKDDQHYLATLKERYPNLKPGFLRGRGDGYKDRLVRLKAKLESQENVLENVLGGDDEGQIARQVNELLDDFLPQPKNHKYSGADSKYDPSVFLHDTRCLNVMVDYKASAHWDKEGLKKSTETGLPEFDFFGRPEVGSPIFVFSGVEEESPLLNTPNVLMVPLLSSDVHVTRAEDVFTDDDSGIETLPVTMHVQIKSRDVTEQQCHEKLLEDMKIALATCRNDADYMVSVRFDVGSAKGESGFDCFVPHLYFELPGFQKPYHDRDDDDESGERESSKRSKQELVLSKLVPLKRKQTGLPTSSSVTGASLNGSEDEDDLSTCDPLMGFKNKPHSVRIAEFIVEKQLNPLRQPTPYVHIGRDQDSKIFSFENADVPSAIQDKDEFAIDIQGKLKTAEGACTPSGAQATTGYDSGTLACGFKPLAEYDDSVPRIPLNAIAYVSMIRKTNRDGSIINSGEVIRKLLESDSYTAAPNAKAFRALREIFFIEDGGGGKVVISIARFLTPTEAEDKAGKYEPATYALPCTRLKGKVFDEITAFAKVVARPIWRTARSWVEDLTEIKKFGVNGNAFQVQIDEIFDPNKIKENITMLAKEIDRYSQCLEDDYVQSKRIRFSGAYLMMCKKCLEGNIPILGENVVTGDMLALLLLREAVFVMDYTTRATKAADAILEALQLFSILRKSAADPAAADNDVVMEDVPGGAYNVYSRTVEQIADLQEVDHNDSTKERLMMQITATETEGVDQWMWLKLLIKKLQEHLVNSPRLANNEFKIQTVPYENAAGTYTSHWDLEISLNKLLISSTKAVEDIKSLLKYTGVDIMKSVTRRFEPVLFLSLCHPQIVLNEQPMPSINGPQFNDDDYMPQETSDSADVPAADVPADADVPAAAGEGAAVPPAAVPPAAAATAEVEAAAATRLGGCPEFEELQKVETHVYWECLASDVFDFVRDHMKAAVRTHIYDLIFKPGTDGERRFSTRGYKTLGDYGKRIKVQDSDASWTVNLHAALFREPAPQLTNYTAKFLFVKMLGFVFNILRGRSYSYYDETTKDENKTDLWSGRRKAVAGKLGKKLEMLLKAAEAPGETLTKVLKYANLQKKTQAEKKENGTKKGNYPALNLGNVAEMVKHEEWKTAGGVRPPDVLSEDEYKVIKEFLDLENGFEESKSFKGPKRLKALQSVHNEWMKDMQYVDVVADMIGMLRALKTAYPTHPHAVLYVEIYNSTKATFDVLLEYYNMRWGTDEQTSFMSYDLGDASEVDSTVTPSQEAADAAEKAAEKAEKAAEKAAKAAVKAAGAAEAVKAERAAVARAAARAAAATQAKLLALHNMFDRMAHEVSASKRATNGVSHGLPVNNILAADAAADASAMDQVAMEDVDSATTDPQCTLVERIAARRLQMETSRYELNGHREFNWMAPDIEHLGEIIDDQDKWATYYLRTVREGRNIFTHGWGAKIINESVLPVLPVPKGTKQSKQPRLIPGVETTAHKNRDLRIPGVETTAYKRRDLRRWSWLLEFKQHNAMRFNSRMSTINDIIHSLDPERSSRRLVLESGGISDDSKPLHVSLSVLAKSGTDTDFENVHVNLGTGAIESGDVTSINLLSVLGANTLSDRLFVSNGFLGKSKLLSIYKDVVESHGGVTWLCKDKHEKLLGPPPPGGSSLPTNDEMTALRMGNLQRNRFEKLQNAFKALSVVRLKTVTDVTIPLGTLRAQVKFAYCDKDTVECEVEANSHLRFGDSTRCAFGSVGNSQQFANTLSTNIRFLHFYDLNESLQPGQLFCPYKFDDLASHAVDVAERIHCLFSFVSSVTQIRNFVTNNFVSLQRNIDSCELLMSQIAPLRAWCASLKMIIMAKMSETFNKAVLKNCKDHGGRVNHWGWMAFENYSYEADESIRDGDTRARLTVALETIQERMDMYTEMAKDAMKLKVEATFLKRVGECIYENASTNTSQRVVTKGMNVQYTGFRPNEFSEDDYPTSEISYKMKALSKRKSTDTEGSRPEIVSAIVSSSTRYLFKGWGPMYTLGGDSRVINALRGRGNLYQDGRNSSGTAPLKWTFTAGIKDSNTDFGLFGLYAQFLRSKANDYEMASPQDVDGGAGDAMEVDGEVYDDDEDYYLKKFKTRSVGHTGTSFAKWALDMLSSDGDVRRQWRSVERLPTYAEILQELQDSSLSKSNCFDGIENLYIPEMKTHGAEFKQFISEVVGFWQGDAPFRLTRSDYQSLPMSFRSKVFDKFREVDTSSNTLANNYTDKSIVEELTNLMRRGINAGQWRRWANYRSDTIFETTHYVKSGNDNFEILKDDMILSDADDDDDDCPLLLPFRTERLVETRPEPNSLFSTIYKLLEGQRRAAAAAAGGGGGGGAKQADDDDKKNKAENACIQCMRCACANFLETEYNNKIWITTMKTLVEDIEKNQERIQGVLKYVDLTGLADAQQSDEERQLIAAQGYAVYMRSDENWSTDIDVRIMAEVGQFKICVYRMEASGRYQRDFTTNESLKNIPQLHVFRSDYTPPAGDEADESSSSKLHFQGIVNSDIRIPPNVGSKDSYGSIFDAVAAFSQTSARGRKFNAAGLRTAVNSIEKLGSKHSASSSLGQPPPIGLRAIPYVTKSNLVVYEALGGHTDRFAIVQEYRPLRCCSHELKLIRHRSDEGVASYAIVV